MVATSNMERPALCLTVLTACRAVACCAAAAFCSSRSLSGIGGQPFAGVAAPEAPIVSRVHRPRRVSSPSAPLHLAGIIDAEIVRGIDDDGDNDDSGAADLSAPKSIVDLSLDSAPEWKNIVVEFVEPTPSGNLRTIPCRMPFTADLDGVTYSIGTPYEDAVAILTDDEDGQPVLVDPDDDDNEEVLQLAATALVENMGDKLRLRRTPRVLTVQGDLRGVTAGYMKDSDVGAADALLDEEDEDDKFLEDFFREQLGEDYDGDMDLDADIDEEEAERLFRLFDVPGLGTEEDNEEAIQKMLRDMVSGEDAKKEEEVGMGDAASDIDQSSKALPLFPFTSPDGKNYAFVQMAQNPLLVGREDPGIDATQRLLLDAEEAAAVIPKLEELFHEDLKDSGLLGS